MMPPDPELKHRLNSIIGWIELGNVQEALFEWQRLSPEQQRRPEALELRWVIDFNQSDWSSALETARTIKSILPHLPQGWLHYAFALRRAEPDGLKKAWAALLPALEMFPEEPIVAYNLSCYACQMGNLAEARDLLRKAISKDNSGEVKSIALCDGDLKPLWREIKTW